jgi:hypothetical protein
LFVRDACPIYFIDAVLVYGAGIVLFRQHNDSAAHSFGDDPKIFKGLHTPCGCARRLCVHHLDELDGRFFIVTFHTGRTVQIALHALAVLTILWSVQLKMAPSSTFFMNSPTLAWEAKWWVRDCMSVSISMKLKYLFFDPIASSPMIFHVVPAEQYKVQWGKWPPNDLPRLDVDETAARQPQQSQAVAGLFSRPIHGCYTQPKVVFGF